MRLNIAPVLVKLLDNQDRKGMRAYMILSIILESDDEEFYHLTQTKNLPHITRIVDLLRNILSEGEGWYGWKLVQPLYPLRRLAKAQSTRSLLVEEENLPQLLLQVLNEYHSNLQALGFVFCILNDFLKTHFEFVEQISLSLKGLILEHEGSWQNLPAFRFFQIRLREGNSSGSNSKNSKSSTDTKFQDDEIVPLRKASASKTLPASASNSFLSKFNPSNFVKSPKASSSNQPPPASNENENFSSNESQELFENENATRVALAEFSDGKREDNITIWFDLNKFVGYDQRLSIQENFPLSELSSGPTQQENLNTFVSTVKNRNSQNNNHSQNSLELLPSATINLFTKIRPRNASRTTALAFVEIPQIQKVKKIVDFKTRRMFLLINHEIDPKDLQWSCAPLPIAFCLLIALVSLITEHFFLLHPFSLSHPGLTSEAIWLIIALFFLSYQIFNSRDYYDLLSKKNFDFENFLELSRSKKFKFEKFLIKYGWEILITIAAVLPCIAQILGSSTNENCQNQELKTANSIALDPNCVFTAFNLWDVIFWTSVLQILIKSNFYNCAFLTLVIFLFVLISLTFTYNNLQQWVYQEFVIQFSIVCLVNLFGKRFRIDFLNYREEKIDLVEQNCCQLSLCLAALVPNNVYEDIISGGMRLSYSYQNMGILFADIKGFTEFSSGRAAEDVVDMLNYLFSMFDAATLEVNVFKIHTIGDCYVAVNTPSTTTSNENLSLQDSDSQVSVSQNKNNLENQSTPALSVLNFAVKMVQSIDRVRELAKTSIIDVRIGLHFGEFVGGLVGTKVLRYFESTKTK